MEDFFMKLTLEESITVLYIENGEMNLLLNQQEENIPEK